MLNGQKIAKELIYDYKGQKIKAFGEAGWNSLFMYLARIIEKIGPILAIKNNLIINSFLKKLIKNTFKEKKIKVLGLATNSKKVKKRFYFFAIKGNKLNGENYIYEAIKKGAIAIVCSKKCKFNDNKLPIIRTSNIRYF